MEAQFDNLVDAYMREHPLCTIEQAERNVRDRLRSEAVRYNHRKAEFRDPWTDDSEDE